MNNNILKSLPMKANLDNQVPYALYPSADNSNLTEAQYTTRLTQAESVNKSMMQGKRSIGTDILFGIGGLCLLIGGVWATCRIIDGREQRLVEKAKADERSRATKEIEEEKRKTAEERARLRDIAKSPKNRYGTILDNNVKEAEPDPIAKYIEALNARKNKLCGTEYSNDLPLSKQQLLGNLIRVGNIVGLGCDSGVGGSTFLMNLSLKAAKGEYADIIPNHNGQELSPMNVLFLSGEEMLSAFNERNPNNWLDLIEYHDNVHFDNPYDCAREIYKRLCNSDKNNLIVLDGLGLIFPQKMTGEDVQTLIDLLKLMMKDASQRGNYWTFLLRVHSTKNETDSKTQKRSKLAGSIKWDQMGDTTMILSYGQKSDERCLHPMKCRNAFNERDLTYVLRLNERPYLHYEYVRTEGLRQRKKWKKLSRREEEKIRAMSEKGMTIPQIVKKTGRDYKIIKKVLNLKE